MNKMAKILLLEFALLLIVGATHPSAVAQDGERKSNRASPLHAQPETFFIISSVDIRKKQLVLKRPTEVTELMQVTDKTICLDEQGKPIQFKELHAGDTVYVTSAPSSLGPRTVRRVRRGPMTVEELHRRYLRQ